jgi:adenylate kinase family enzyme
VKREPRHFGAYSGLGMIRAEMGENARAVAAFELARKWNPHIVGIDSEIERLKAMGGDVPAGTFDGSVVVSDCWAMARIHIVGASGSGTSTLGVALAERLGLPHVDADSLFWLLTDPPFTTQRPRDERQALLFQSISVTGHWVFSGSAVGWATSLEPLYSLIVFLHLDPSVRMARLRRRQAARYGARVEGQGDMVVANLDFLKWAAAYDTAGPEQRSLIGHEAWMALQAAPILRLDSSAPVQDLVAAVLSELAGIG